MRNENAKETVKVIRECEKETESSYREVCRLTLCPYKTFLRWNERMLQGWELIRTPGPKKTEPLDAHALAKAVNEMKHCVHRSLGFAGILFAHGGQMSRRDLADLVAEVRDDVRRAARREMERIVWHVSRICWSIDDIEHDRHRLYSHQVQDLGSKFRMVPKAGHLLDGAEVAKNLRDLFEEYGAPLFVKRDNGKTLNADNVDNVLSEYLVIPINSPTYYPRYNGSMERGQQDVHDLLTDIDLTRIEPDLFAATLESRIHRLNERPRPCLADQPPYMAFFQEKSPLARYDRRRRKEIHTEITNMAARIVASSGDDGSIIRAAAWRVSVKNWLRRGGFITVTSGGRVLPHFP